MSDERHFLVTPEEAGLRLDIYLAGAIDDASRSLLKTVIKDERVHINQRLAKRPSRVVTEGDDITVNMPPAPVTDLLPEDLPLEILYEDEHLLFVNKPSGLVVHPAPGHPNGTLVNAILFHCPDFQRPSTETDDPASLRPGIVHRLDKDTSGVLVVAKSQAALDGLGAQVRAHAFDRQYVALVRGEFKEETGVIRAAIGRSTSDRKRMSVMAVHTSEAVTHFRVRERFGIASLVELKLETGRTHQIRVHLRFAGRPILGDPVYGVTDYSSWGVDAALKDALRELPGQALHAERLGLEHPITKERLLFTAPLPREMQAVLDQLRPSKGKSPR